MKNVQFDYLYRDNANFKKYGSVVFSNPERLKISKIKSKIVSRLVDGEYFTAQAFELPLLFFSDKNQDDHEWHEFLEVIETEEPATDNRTIDQFLKKFELPILPKGDDEIIRNKIEQIQVNYLRSSRTIETILLTNVKNLDIKKVVYLYNYEGYHFRVFENIFEIADFLNNDECKILAEFEDEDEADRFLSKYDFLY